jgi:KaiC/GvpD/RAD55 family RecA-like ATPase
MSVLLMVIDACTFQQDLRDILLKFIEEGDKTAYVSLYNDPLHLIENILKPEVGAEKILNLLAVNAATDTDLKHPQILNVGSGSLTSLGIHLNDFLMQHKPKYLVFDSLGAILKTQEDPIIFIKSLKNKVNELKVNTVILIISEKIQDKQVSDIQAMLDGTIYYEDMKREAAGTWNA